MDVAVYHPWTYLRGGIERTLVELLARSEHRWTLYTHHFDPDQTFPELAGAHVVELAPRVDVRRSFGPLVRGALTMARTSLPPGHRALLVSSDGLGDLVAFRSPVPVACYCHTPLKILHDPTTRARLRQRSPRQAVALDALGPLFAAVDRRAWSRYRHAFANSAETARRLQRAGLRPGGATPVEVLHPGVDIERFGRPGGERRRQFVVAGRIMWQKQVELAIDAFALARRQGLDAELVVAGAVDDKSRAYHRALVARAEGLPVRFETGCSDEQLADLYATSLACVFTAPNEDWGIVPLEAMAAGTPVLAPNAGGVRESVLDGRTGWLVAHRPEAFAERMLHVARAGAALEPMRHSARQRAAAFGWDRFVRRIDEVLACLAEGAPVPSARPPATAGTPIGAVPAAGAGAVPSAGGDVGPAPAAVSDPAAR